MLGEEEGEADFKLVLCRIVLKLAAQHPFHILPQLFALAHEREFGGNYDGAAHAKHNMSLLRLETSKMLVAQLKAIPLLTSLVDCTQQMLLAYIDLANASTMAMQKSGFTKGIKYNKIQPRGKRFDQVYTYILTYILIQHIHILIHIHIHTYIYTHTHTY
jgi:hypothetical protein